MTNADAAEDRPSGLDRQARRKHAVQCTGNLRSCGIIISEARTCEGQIGVERQPGRQPRVVRPFNSYAAAWAAGFGGPSVTHEQEF
jgi:hypothetical protein